MKQVIITVTEDGHITVNNDHFQKFELRGLMLSIADNVAAEQHAANTIQAFSSNSSLKQSLHDLVMDGFGETIDPDKVDFPEALKGMGISNPKAEEKTDVLSALTEWKGRWRDGDTKFVPELFDLVEQIVQRKGEKVE